LTSNLPLMSAWIAVFSIGEEASMNIRLIVRIRRALSHWLLAHGLSPAESRADGFSYRFSVLVKALRALWIAVLLAAGLAAPVCAEPGKVVVGTYINKMNEVSFKDSKFSLDFYIWFRWKPVGELANYKPIESMELINGRIDGKTSIVE
jgi:hypothetical protein